MSQKWLLQPLFLLGRQPLRHTAQRQRSFLFPLGRVWGCKLRKGADTWSMIMAELEWHHDMEGTLVCLVALEFELYGGRVGICFVPRCVLSAGNNA